MEKIVSQLPQWLNIACVVVTALVAVATAYVQLTTTTKDDEKLKGIVGFLVKVKSYLPTVGINPDTKKLKEENAKLKAENAKVADNS